MRNGGLFGGGSREEVFVGLKNFIVAATNPAFWSGVGRVVIFGVFQILHHDRPGVVLGAGTGLVNHSSPRYVAISLDPLKPVTLGLHAMMSYFNPDKGAVMLTRCWESSR